MRVPFGVTDQATTSHFATITTMKKELPEDRAALEHLMHYVDRLLVELEPLSYQVRGSRRIVPDKLANDSTAIAHNKVFLSALIRKLAEGIPPHQLLVDYLDMEKVVIPPAKPEEELLHLDQLIRSNTANEAQHVRYLILVDSRIDEYRDWIKAFVNVCHDLHRRIIERLTLRAVPETAEQGQASENNLPHVKTNSLVQLDKFAVALDGRNCWQVFTQFGTQWRHQGKLDPPPRKGREFNVLKAFCEHGGILNRVQLIELVHTHFSRIEGLKILDNKVKPTISRLRTSLKAALKLPSKVNPIRWEDSSGIYRLLVEIGHVVEDDNGRLQFQQREKLS